MPEFCYSCERIGHAAKEYLFDKILFKRAGEYEPWLRANPRWKKEGKNHPKPQQQHRKSAALDVTDESAKKQQALQPDVGWKATDTSNMEGKVADTSNMETRKANSSKLSIHSAPKIINDLPTDLDSFENDHHMSFPVMLGTNENVLKSDTTIESNKVLGTVKSANHDTWDFGPAAYHFPSSSGEHATQVNQQGFSSSGNLGANKRVLCSKCGSYGMPTR
ncbi:hypothetical protein V6N13_110065 [Hibiscus sabdariffa]|uniref:CCHC-type domain-containing protein n=1 Tax=Hibiscus sabdariffa TaxID=183260 RepID=A0ABR2BU51_9ROSI